MFLGFHSGPTQRQPLSNLSARNIARNVLSDQMLKTTLSTLFQCFMLTLTESAGPIRWVNISSMGASDIGRAVGVSLVAAMQPQNGVILT